MEEKSTQALEAEVRGLHDVLEVAKVVVSSLDLSAVLDNILRSGMDILEVPSGSVALYCDDVKELTYKAHAGLSDEFVAKDRWKVTPGGLTERVMQEGDIFAVSDMRDVDFFNNPLVVKEGIRSLVAVPLKIEDKTVGILYLDDFKPRHFSEDRLKLLRILQSFAAMSIQNARLHEQTRHRACTDGLTGLYNHRQFKELFAVEMSRAERFEKPMSLVMLDVDNFKMFNDRYGHQVGDQVLVKVSEILRKNFREIDFVCRYGGEEFIVILPETELSHAIVAAERARQEIEEESIRDVDAEGSDPVTVSVGVAAYPRDGKRLEFLLKVVDDLLYGAKQLGKNKIYYVKKD